MSLTANQIRALEADNLIYNGVNIIEEFLRSLDGYENISIRQKSLLIKWVNNAKEWQKG
jgi:hypothetical protein